MNRKLTATLLILAAVLANVGFTALGSIFNYPDVLDEPAGKVLAAFRDSQGAVSALVPRCSRSRPALLAPIAIGVGRLSSQQGDAHRGARRHHRGRRAGHRLAALADPRPRLRVRRGEQQPGRRPRRPRHVHDGERRARHRPSARPLGYLLTATWTVLVVVALGRRYAGRWFQVLGVTSAVLVFAGVFSPLDLSGVDTANFFGYVLWSAWLVAFGVVILVHERRTATSTTSASAPARASVSV